MIEISDMNGGNDDDEDDVDCEWVRERNKKIYLSYFPFLNIRHLGGLFWIHLSKNM